MTKLQEKAQGQVKQMVGQMIGDDRLVQEGREQQQGADQVQGASDAAQDDTNDRAIRQRTGAPESKAKREDRR